MPLYMMQLTRSESSYHDSFPKSCCLYINNLSCLFSDAVIGSYEGALNNTANGGKSHPTPRKCLERKLPIHHSQSVDTGDLFPEKKKLSFSSPNLIEARDGRPRLSQKATWPGMVSQRENPVSRSYINSIKFS